MKKLAILIFLALSPSQSSARIHADVDQQGIVDSNDAILILRNSIGLDMSNTAWHASATTGDANCDGVSNSIDAMLTLKASLGLNMENTSWCEIITCGNSDCTEELQAQIDLTPLDGILDLPEGEYFVDAAGGGIQPKSNMTLQLSPGTIIKALPNGSAGYNVINLTNVSNVNIYGGTVAGERDQHTGTTGEWGRGILINSSNNIHVSGVRIIDAWGDGIEILDTPSVRTSNITLTDIVALNNRRQGISIISGSNITISGGEYSNTNGTPPSAGIDIEPNDSDDIVSNVVFDGISAKNNDGSGILVYNTHGGHVSGVAIRNCEIMDNGYDGTYIIGVYWVAVEQNTLQENGGPLTYRAGIKIEDCNSVSIDQNTVTDTFPGRRGIVISTYSSEVDITNNEICVVNLSNAIDDLSNAATLLNNTYCGNPL